MRVANYWEGKHYAFFCNKECEFFPCHQTKHPEKFNCLFCYCPLYALGDKCGGNFQFTRDGIKDCSNCALPHNRKISGNYGNCKAECGFKRRKIRKTGYKNQND